MNPIAGLLQSRKTWAALFATFLIGVPIVFGWSSWTPQQKQDAITTATYAVAGVWGVKVAAIAYEDGKQKSGPQSQVNVGSKVDNTTAPAVVTPTPAPQPAPQPVAGAVMMTNQQLAMLARTLAAAQRPPVQPTPPAPTPETIAAAHAAQQQP